MDTDLLKCCIVASLTDVEYLTEANNQDSVGILVRSADGKVFRIAVSEVPQR